MSDTFYRVKQTTNATPSEGPKRSVRCGQKLRKRSELPSETHRPPGHLRVMPGGGKWSRSRMERLPPQRVHGLAPKLATLLVLAGEARSSVHRAPGFLHGT